MNARNVFVTLFFLSFLPGAMASDPQNGSSLFGDHCAICHGENGRGLSPDMPDFSAGDGLWTGDRNLLERVEKGGRTCPSFAGILDRQEILDVIAYLRSLS